MNTSWRYWPSCCDSSTSIGRHLHRLRNLLAAADQPPHAEQIENADPQPVPQAVVRDTVLARPIDYIDIVDRMAFAADQRRQEAMQPVEIGKPQEQVARKRLQAAAGVARAVAQDGGAHPIGDARLEPLEWRRAAADPLAGDEAKARHAGFERA